MLSINTNLQSIIAQNSLKQSTLKLNTAIERMSTGFKINHALDNAANYSISTNMTTKLGAYQVAEDNTAMGLDLLTTASDSVNLVSDKLARLRALAEQAANGTYSTQSLKAINTEANAILDEIDRTFANTDYNGIKLFGEKTGDFITEIKRIDTSEMTKLAEVDETQALTSGEYSISSAQELAKLAAMTNDGKIGADCVFVLANNIDLNEFSSGTGWIPIGFGPNSSYFRATFDGNGYEVSNLYINNANIASAGLFGTTMDATIKNIGVNGISIYGMGKTGSLVGSAQDSTIINSYAINGTNTITGTNAGGLIGHISGATISECYSSADVISIGTSDQWNFGGLIGLADAGFNTIKNCYTTGKVNGDRVVGGLIGSQAADGIIENCYATGTVTGNYNIGGVFGNVGYADVKNCYASGNILGRDPDTASKLAGFCGEFSNSATLENCFSTGNVIGGNYIAGFCSFIGANAIVTNCYSTGDIINARGYVGGFCSDLYDSGTINNSASFGKISGDYEYIGGFVNHVWSTGSVDITSTINNCYTFSTIEKKRWTYI